MYKKCAFAVSMMFWLGGCGRNAPSPVEIKVDQDYGVETAGGNFEPKTGIVSSVENIYGESEKFKKSESEISKNSKIEDENDEFGEVSAGYVASQSKTSGTKEPGLTFNEQAAILATPKITQSARSKPDQDDKKATDKKKSPQKESVDSKKSEKDKKNTQKTSSSKLIYPVNGSISSKFGDDMGDGIINDGINIKAAEGTNVLAAGDGTVIYAGNIEEDFGNVIIIQHGSTLDNVITSYAHLKNIKIKNNATVKAGDVIGTVGKTGDVKTPQLHFEVMKNKKPVNPVKYLQK